VPDETLERTLEQLLAYPERTASADDAFVDSVMRQVGRQQKIRKIILYVFGFVGAVFGAIGATLLSGKITWLFTEVLNGTLMMQAVLLVIAAGAFYIWFMNDELTVDN
jgi:hypothetical protein